MLIQEENRLNLTPRYRTGKLLRRYWTLFKVSFQERMEYRWNVLIYVLFVMIPVLIGVYLWGVVFNRNNDPQIMQYITTYYIVAAFVGWRIAQYHWNFSNDIREGRMATQLLRPMSYPAKTFWYEVGGRTWSTIITLPVFVVVALAMGNNFRVPANPLTWLLVILSFMLAYLMSFFLTGALGLVTVWQNQPEGFFVLYSIGAQWLGGTFLPLSLMPGGIGEWLQWLPFAYIYNMPVRIFLETPGYNIWQGFAVQLVWVILAGLFFNWLWRKAIHRYEVFEG
ncbi:MAG TPA: ABC-2 family transporter protein [Chloroflexia bacterium]|nr:ABC-2 family transporter protein [Chloroflexia bacterium]